LLWAARSIVTGCTNGVKRSLAGVFRAAGGRFDEKHQAVVCP
jgi:hypothetical protein